MNIIVYNPGTIFIRKQEQTSCRQLKNAPFQFDTIRFLAP